MSAAGADNSGEVGAVLGALWEARGREVPMGALLPHVGGSSAKMQDVLEGLAGCGCRIERSPGGVCLVTAGLARWREIIFMTARREGRRLGRNAVVYPEISSTNDGAWRVAGAEDGDGFVVLADHQTAGRGRLGRVWAAKAGQSVLMSVVLQGMAAEAMDRLTLLAGLATAVGVERAVEEAGGRIGGGRVGIRWPNDLMVGGRKLAGILVETRKVEQKWRSGTIDVVVVGIGINVAQGRGDFPEELGGRGISIFEAAGILVDRLRVVMAVLGNLEDYLKLRETEGEERWLGQWKERCEMLGGVVRVRSGEHVITGQVLDVAPLQGLVVRDDGGGTHFFSARTSTVLTGDNPGAGRA